MSSSNKRPRSPALTPPRKAPRRGNAPSSPTAAAQQPDDLRWLPKIGTLMHATYHSPQPSSKIAAFDLHHTLVTPMSGARHSATAYDWKWWSSDVEGKENAVPEKLKELHNNGYAILVFTSQWQGDAELMRSFKLRVANICSHLDVPLRLFVSTEHDIYRKPVHGAWLEFVKHWNGGKAIDSAESFFVGDAAGAGNSPMDYDRKFAYNAGLPFMTPGTFFLDKEPYRNMSFKGFCAAKYDHSLPLFMPTNTPLIPRSLSDFEPPPKDVVLLIGAPGSGKTHFANKYFSPLGYIRITGSDPYLQLKKQLTASPSSSFVIDTRLPSRQGRSMLIHLVRTASPSHRIRLLKFTASEELSKHNSVYSVLFDGEKTPDGKARVFTTEEEYRRWYEELEDPRLDEGFDEIKQINFKFDKSGPRGDERFKLWKLFLDPYPYDRTKKP
ncbi:hypothetical protein JCM10207_007986 [Rhodosporidiobolus poonsookiae]